MRNTTYRVHQDEIAISTHFSTVSRRTKVFHDFICGFFIVLAGNVCAQFIQSRCRTSRCRGITRFIRNIRSIEIPIRNKVFRQVRIIKDKIINLLSHIQILLIVSIAVTHGISVDGPSLSARPGRLISIALCSLFLTHLTGYRIIVHYMITTIIVTEVILHGCISMFHGNVIVSRIP